MAGVRHLPPIPSDLGHPPTPLHCKFAEFWTENIISEWQGEKVSCGTKLVPHSPSNIVTWYPEIFSVAKGFFFRPLEDLVTVGLTESARSLQLKTLVIVGGGE